MERKVYKCGKFEKLALLHPPPWYQDNNTQPPSIPQEIIPMRIIEDNFPYEPMGNLLTTDRKDLILVNKLRNQTKELQLDQIELKIDELPNTPEGSLAHLKNAVADYISAVLQILDDACHQQNPIINVNEEKIRLIEIIDQLRWRQGMNNLRKQCEWKICQKKQMITKIREVIANLEKGKDEILEGDFPKKHYQ
ncbi:hypothetical protein SS50377_21040 [Spironucleus salmonicida]|uniref:Uncharacterized protein n=1 Tax=Spironucleus salmonicida TaxID=348837 RepID=V6LGN7_9EUKA|nr:hypothetical protein SS50377_21040 [Spironucleus salmonicida]|eukprot:EST43700.1 Hypothetical protein SS50377_16752 [Spironucleus salmonicida]